METTAPVDELKVEEGFQLYVPPVPAPLAVNVELLPVQTVNELAVMLISGNGFTNTVNVPEALPELKQPDAEVPVTV